MSHPDLLPLSLSFCLCPVDADEIKRLGKRFKKLDLDNSGSLSVEEFMSLPELQQNPLVQRVIDIFDTDGNGEVDFKGMCGELPVLDYTTLFWSVLVCVNCFKDTTTMLIWYWYKLTAIPNLITAFITFQRAFSKLLYFKFSVLIFGVPLSQFICSDMS